MTAEAQLLKGVSHQDYHADFPGIAGPPRLSRSVATILLYESPLRAWSRHPELGGVPESEEDLSPQQMAARERGSALHALLADGAGPGIALIPFTDWRKDAAKAARDEARAAGCLPILEHKYAELQEAAGRIRESLRRYGIELGGYESEVTALWTSTLGVACKARLDKLSLAEGMIYDFKTVDRISKRRFEFSIEPDGLHMQWASNVEGVVAAKPALAGRLDMEFIQVEVKPPYDAAIFPLEPAYKDLGEQAWRRAQARWKELLARPGAVPWPGYGRQAPVAPRPWQLEREFTEQLAATREPAWSKGEE